VPVGKAAFSEEQLFDNASRVLEAIEEAKPASIKGKFIKTAAVASSMNPGLRLAV
jgi:large subunit ribosomal protein L1